MLPELFCPTSDMLLMLFANYTVHRLFVDGNWYEMSFPLVYVRITFITLLFTLYVIFVETARNLFGL